MQKIIVSVLGAAILGLAAVVYSQRAALRDAHERLAALERLRSAGPATGSLQRRLEDLDQAVAKLTRTTDSLKERSQFVLSSNELDALQRRFLDASMPDKERIAALRFLRRNRGLTDGVVLRALGWVQSSKDSDLRRDLLQELDGATNSVLRQPLLAMAAGDADPKVRAEAVENLRHVTGDSEVERGLWEIAVKDPEPKVRERAQDALREGPMTPVRMARFKEHAANPQVPLEERLDAMRTLVQAGADVAGIVASLAQLAQAAPDPATRARLYRAFEGGRDPAMLPPLMDGLQDADPAVRKAAADALGGFGADPRVRQKLEYVAQSDTDNKVRREAQQALKELQEPR